MEINPIKTKLLTFPGRASVIRGIFDFDAKVKRLERVMPN